MPLLILIDATMPVLADSDNLSPGFEVNGLLGSSDDRHKAGSEPGVITFITEPDFHPFFICEARINCLYKLGLNISN